jgi:dihydrofolate reductase
MAVFHCHVAVSLDGRIARPDGSVAWLEGFPPDAFGFAAFHAGVDAILMGRATYEAVRAMGEWPHQGKPVVVLTHRALHDAPPGVVARGGDIAAVADELAAAGHARIWVEGGGQVVRQMLEIGRLDVLEMALIPRVLGAGLPLFPDGTRETALRLVSGAPRPGGALHLIYAKGMQP